MRVGIGRWRSYAGCKTYPGRADNSGDISWHKNRIHPIKRELLRQLTKVLITRYFIGASLVIFLSPPVYVKGYPRGDPAAAQFHVGSNAAMGQGGLILLVNKTPYAWNRTNQKSYNMNHWDNQFPEVLLPGVCEKVYVEWESSPDDHDDAGEIFYELAETGGLKFQIWSRGRKRDKEGADSGLSVYFENLVTGQQPRRSWLNLGWQHDGYVGFVLTGNVHSFYSSAILKRQMDELHRRREESEFAHHPRHA